MRKLEMLTLALIAMMIWFGFMALWIYCGGHIS